MSKKYEGFQHELFNQWFDDMINLESLVYSLPRYSKDKNWEKQTIERIAMESLSQQKSSKRWSIFFKLITLIYLGWILFFVLVVQGPAGFARQRKILVFYEN